MSLSTPTNSDSGLPPASTETQRLLGPYRWAATICHGERVLDLGGGRGAGSREIAIHAVPSSLVAVDVSEEEVVSMARGPYQRLVADGQALPFTDESFSLVLSFEVVEHVRDPIALLQEARRVVEPQGVVLVSTPNRRVRLLPFQAPWNPEHLTEYTGHRFARLLGRVFPAVRVLGIGADPVTYRNYRAQWRRACLRRIMRLPRAAWRQLPGRRMVFRLAPEGSRSSGPETSPPAHGELLIASLLSTPPLNYVAVCSCSDQAASAATARLDRIRIPW